MEPLALALFAMKGLPEAIEICAKYAEVIRKARESGQDSVSLKALDEAIADRKQALESLRAVVEFKHGDIRD